MARRFDSAIIFPWGKQTLEGRKTIPGRGKNKSFSVLLISPALKIENYSREDLFRTYLSLGTLASALRDQAFVQKFIHLSGMLPLFSALEFQNFSFDVHVLNLNWKPPQLTFVEHLESFLKKAGIEPRLIGMTATSTQLDEAAEMAAAAKALAPEALRVIGGPHVSIVPSSFLAETEYQVACIGEGIETFVDLALTILAKGPKALSQVSGIAYKEYSSGIHLTPPRKFLFTLDDYPFPSESLGLFADDLEDSARNAGDLVYLLGGFGCPHRCIFCAQQAIHRGLVRERSAENIFAEIQKLYPKGFRKFAIVQETFFTNAERVKQFCSLIEDSRLSLEWTAEARADQLTFRQLERFKKGGLRFIQIGVETGDQTLLESLGKKINLQRVKELRGWCETLQIDTAFYMLVGLPGQDWQSILRSGIFLRDHLPYNRITMHVSVAVAIPYPGTKIFEEASVRLVNRDPESRNWPDRNVAVIVNEEVEFMGENYTETDLMTSEEIMEAYTYLDDFGHFLLRAKYDLTYTHEKRLQAHDFFNRIFYMIERRTIRDLILQAQEEISPEKYRKAHAEILQRDNGREAHFKDITSQNERQAIHFTHFLANGKFQNGFQVMKRFSVPNRVKWMKICSLAWERGGKKFSAFRFEQDSEGLGDEFNRRLEGIPSAELNHLLEAYEHGLPLQGFSSAFQANGKQIRFYRFCFELDELNSILRIRSH
jgi:radical SAM superfamily enzyme YgiQ (UPF0313 family)